MNSIKTSRREKERECEGGLRERQQAENIWPHNSLLNIANCNADPLNLLECYLLARKWSFSFSFLPLSFLFAALILLSQVDAGYLALAHSINTVVIRFYFSFYFSIRCEISHTRCFSIIEKIRLRSREKIVPPTMIYYEWSHMAHNDVFTRANTRHFVLLSTLICIVTINN